MVIITNYIRTPRASRTWGNIVKACPILTAFMCTASGLYLFGHPPPEAIEGVGVKAAGIFRTAVLMLLWKVKIYPKSLKKLSKYMQYIVEFLLAMYIIEFLQAEFWVPLERAIKKFHEKTSTVASTFAIENLRPLGIEMGEVTEHLAIEWIPTFTTYGVSMFFFTSVSHAIKVIDLRDIKYGPEPFVNALGRLYRAFKEMVKMQNTRALTYKQEKEEDSSKIREEHDDRGGGHPRRIGWRGEQKAIEWHRKMQHDELEEDDYSDFEMDFN